MKLTEEQYNIINSEDERMHIVAGAGVGKTSVLIKRMSSLIKKNKFKPEKILLTSFSRVANQEIKNKLLLELDKHIVDSMHISTLHSLCYSILLSNKEVLGYKKMDVVNSQYYNKILYNISMQENEPLTSKEVRKIGRKIDTYKISKVINSQSPSLSSSDRYLMRTADSKMKESGKITYIEILTLFLHLMSIDSKARNMCNNMFDYLAIDECLPYHIPILLSDGTSRSIGDIVENKEQLEVISYNEESGEQEKCKIIGWSKTPNQKRMVKIGLQSGKYITCTVDHKIFTYNRGWIFAGDINTNDTCQIIREGLFKSDVISIEDVSLNDLFVYDLTIEKNHNFYANGVLVHNCQDTSNIQFEIIKHFINQKTHVLTVGDVRQTIYGFTGSHFSFWDDFQKEINSKLYTLSETFRFGNNIANLADCISDKMVIPEYYLNKTTTSIILNNDIQKEINLCSESRIPHICDDIENKLKNGYEYGDINVLFRTNKESIPYQKELTKRGIPFNVSRGSLLERKEIQFITSIVNLIYEYDPNVAIFVLKQYDNFINEKSFVLASNNTEDKNIFSILKTGANSNIKGIGVVRKNAFKLMLERLETVKNILNTDYNDGNENVFIRICNAVDINDTVFMDNEINSDGISQYEERWEIIETFNDLYYTSGEYNLNDFFNKMKVDFVGASDEQGEINKVRLRTIHSSKGTTLPVVYLIIDKMCNSFFTNFENVNDINDELFLLYVAVTRARDHLYIYHDNPYNFHLNFIFNDVIEEKYIKSLNTTDCICVNEPSLNNGCEKYESKKILLSSSEENELIHNFKTNKATVLLKNYKLIQKTQKALLLDKDGSTTWFPKSHIGIDGGNYYVSSWIAKQKNLDR